MQYGTLDWILEQKEDIHGKTGEIHVWNLVNSNGPMLEATKRDPGTCPL